MNHIYYVPTILGVPNQIPHANSIDGITRVLATDSSGYRIANADSYYEIRDEFIFEFALAADIQVSGLGGDLLGLNLIKDFHRRIVALGDICMYYPGAEGPGERLDHMLDSNWVGVYEDAGGDAYLMSSLIDLRLTADRRGVMLVLFPGRGRPTFEQGTILRFKAYCANYEEMYPRVLPLKW